MLDRDNLKFQRLNQIEHEAEEDNTGGTMPIYDYLCEECGFSVEIITTKATTRQLRPCKCGKKMKRVPSRPFLMQESMRKRILGKGLQRMPETMKRQMRGEAPFERKKDDFDEKYEPYT
jgi:putative FmdB family regulatory protein